MQFPLILNNRWRSQLIKQYQDACHAIDDAVVAMSACEPIPRDYYRPEEQPADGHSNWVAAHREHNTRMMALEDVRSQLEKLLHHCVDSETTRYTLRR